MNRMSSIVGLKLVAMLFYFFRSDVVLGDPFNVIKNQYKKYDNDMVKNHGYYPVGIQIESLFSQGKYQDVDKRLIKARSNKALPQTAILWRLLINTIKQGNEATLDKLLQELDGSPFLKSTALVKELYQGLSTEGKNKLIKSLIKSEFFEFTPHSSCPFFELDKRKKRAEFLYQLVAEHTLDRLIHHKVLHELYVTLPEVIPVNVASQKLPSQNTLNTVALFAEFQNNLKASDFMKRMDALLTFGKNQAARETFIMSKKLWDSWSVLDTCEAHYIDAKIDRKLKEITRSRQKMDEIIVRCPEPVRKKARFMDLMMASIKNDLSSLPKFDAFVAHYPTDSLTDDILMFKASILADHGRIDDAHNVWDHVIAHHKNGDMIHRALFLKAFSLAGMKKTEKSMRVFQQLKEISEPGSLDHACAEYWSARLAIYNDINNLSNLKQAQLASSKKQLQKLALFSHPNVYSWLSYNLLKSLGVTIKTAQLKKNIDKRDPIIINNDKDLSFIESLARHGFRAEALALLEELEVNNDAPQRAAKMAMLYDMMNRPEMAHQKLVSCDATVASLLSKSIPHTFNRISFPRPFLKDIDQAIKITNIPRSLALAVIGSESKFITGATSWADAMGLMQLTKNSAQEEARRLSLANVEEHDLYHPYHNILLGSSLLRTYWQRFDGLIAALGAYNAGPSRVRAWVKKNNGAPLDTFIENVPFKETRNYIKSVLGSMFAYALFFEGVESLPPLAGKLSSPVSLKKVKPLE